MLTTLRHCRFPLIGVWLRIFSSFSWFIWACPVCADASLVIDGLQAVLQLPFKGKAVFRAAAARPAALLPRSNTPLLSALLWIPFRVRRYLQYYKWRRHSTTADWSLQNRWACLLCTGKCVLPVKVHRPCWWSLLPRTLVPESCRPVHRHMRKKYPAYWKTWRKSSTSRTSWRKRKHSDRQSPQIQHSERSREW